MAGVAQHSTYRNDPLGRFERTAQFVNATTYGTTAEAEAAIAMVRRIHSKISGVAPDGRPYRADDPALLSWVHNVEVDSIMTAYRRFGPRVRAGEDDQYVAEMTRVGAAVGADDLPTTAQDLHLWVSRHPERNITAEARRAGALLALPTDPGTVARAVRHPGRRRDQSHSRPRSLRAAVAVVPAGRAGRARSRDTRVPRRARARARTVTRAPRRARARRALAPRYGKRYAATVPLFVVAYTEALSSITTTRDAAALTVVEYSEAPAVLNATSLPLAVPT